MEPIEQRDSHSGRFAQLLENGFANEYDVVFLIGVDRTVVKGHKFILRLHSVKFLKLFNDSDESTFEVWDTSAPDFKEFLQLIYTGLRPITLRNPIGILRLSVTYAVPDLVAHCESLIAKSLSIETAIEVYENSAKAELLTVQNKALEFICRNANAIFDTRQILKFTPLNFGAVLGQDSLQVRNELQVFDALLSWGRHECERIGNSHTMENYRLILGNLIPLVRFSNMDKEEFMAKVSSIKLLTAEEVDSIMNTKPSRTLNPRQYLADPDAEYTVIRLGEIDKHRWKHFYKHDEYSICFKSSEDILMTAIGMDIPYNPDVFCPAEIPKPIYPSFRIEDIAIGITICHWKTNHKSFSSAPGEKPSQPIKCFVPDQGVLLKANTWYKVQFIVNETYNAVYSHGGKLYQEVEVRNGHLVIFEFTQARRDYSSVKHGIMPLFVFKMPMHKGESLITSAAKDPTKKGSKHSLSHLFKSASKWNPFGWNPLPRDDKDPAT